MKTLDTKYGYGRSSTAYSTSESTLRNEYESDMDDLSNQIDLATKEMKLAITNHVDNLLDGREVVRDDVIPQILKELKVGGTVVLGKSSGYMGDGGDDRDVGYSFVSRVLTKKGYIMEVTPKYGHDSLKLNISSDLDWLRSSDGYSVYSINGVSESNLKEGFSGAVLTELGARYRLQMFHKALKQKAEKVKLDWTQGTKNDLVRIIQGHFEKEGKHMRGLTTASKPMLIDIIKKYKIRE